MHRFFISPEAIQNNHFMSADKELVHQLGKVLKMRAGEKIVLLDNTEQEYTVELQGLRKTEVSGKIVQKISKPDISHERSIHLFVPPLKNPSRWEWMLEKCTEIGVASFTPLITERTEVKELRKLDRLQRIIKEAAEQSGRTKLPEIREALEFKNVMATSGTNLIATIGQGASIKKIKLENAAVNLFIGPVGDFTKEEIELALHAGFQPVTLGSQILRTETAGMVASSLLYISIYP